MLSICRCSSLSLQLVILYSLAVRREALVQGTLDALDCAGRAVDALREVARVRHL